MTLQGPRRKPHGISRARSSAVALPPLQGLALECAPEGRGQEGASLGLLGDCQALALPSGRGLCSFQKSGHLGCWAPRESQPPRWWEQEGAIVWGFNIQNGKNARKLYSIFPVEVIILHRTKRNTKRADPPPDQPRGWRAGAAAPRGFCLAFVLEPGQSEATVFTLALTGAV